MQSFAPSLTVNDINLAAALATYHVPPDPRGFEDHFDNEGRSYRCWHFLDRATHTGETTESLIAAWRNPDEFNAKNPTHPWAYIMIAFKNRAELYDRCSKNAPKFLISRGKSIAMIDPNAPRDVRETILAKIGI